MQLEIADVLEPLYRVGEEWEKLAQIYEVQLVAHGRRRGAPGAAAPAGRDRRAQAGRSDRRVRVVGPGGATRIPRRELALDELLRLVRSTHQWDEYVATMSEAASADRGRRRCAATCCCAWPPVFENDLGDLERAEQALVAGAARARPRTRRRWRRSIASTRRRGCTTTWRRSCSSASPSPTRRTSWSSCTCGWAGSTPRRSRTSRAPSPATWRCWSTSRAR